MRIERINIDELNLDSKNARKHDAKNLKAIADSLEQFGQRKPIVVWGKTVIAGNGTMAAARSLGWREIDIARVPDDWSSDQVKAYALADNRSAELAVWDEQVLASQLLELQEAEFDIELLGFENLSQPNETELVEAFEGLGQDKPEMETITFSLHVSQMDIVKFALEKFKKQDNTDNPLNSNANGNALTGIIESWLESNVS